MITRHEALRLLALEVVGLTDPARVHDDERLRWGDIREALAVDFHEEDEPVEKVIEAFDSGEKATTQHKCWQAGKIKDHLCGPKCVNEATQKEIDAFVAERRADINLI